jgi:hypothetical protein
MHQRWVELFSALADSVAEQHLAPSRCDIETRAACRVGTEDVARRCEDAGAGGARASPSYLNDTVALNVIEASIGGAKSPTSWLLVRPIYPAPASKLAM